MAWQRYNTHVRVGSSSNGVILPVTNLTVSPEPFTNSGSTVVTLFDGRRKLEGVTWGYRIELEWHELRGDQDKLRQAIELLVGTPAGVNVFLNRLPNGTFSATEVIPNCIPEITGDELKATFVQRARRRAGSLTLLSSSQHLPLYNWLTS